jgi:hypothetical protein
MPMIAHLGADPIDLFAAGARDNKRHLVAYNRTHSSDRECRLAALNTFVL